MDDEAAKNGSDLARQALAALADPERLDKISQSVIELAQASSAATVHEVDVVARQLTKIISDHDADKALMPTGGAGHNRISMVTNSKGIVVAANEGARGLLKAQIGKHVRETLLGLESQNRLQQHLASEDIPWTILQARFEGSPSVSLLAAANGTGSARTSMIISIDDEWSEELAQQVSDLFQLSAAETDIARLLAAGNTPVQIATARGRSVETVRAQVKTLIAKTETENQAELLRRFASIQRAGEWMQASPLSSPHTNILQTLSGRSVHWVEYGDPAGIPLVFVHGAIGGLAPIGYLDEQLRHYGYRWIAVARPGYGQTSTAETADANVALAADDLTCVLDHLGLNKVDLCAYSIGAATAFEWVQQNPARIGRLIVACGAVPDFDAREGHSMPLGQRAMALAARLSPQLIRMLVKMGIRRMNAAGPQGMGRIFFKESGADHAALGNPMILDHMWRAYQFHSGSDPEAFVHDVIVANTPVWQTRNAPNCAITFLHGDADQTVPEHLACSFAERMRGQMNIVPTAGHLLPVSHAESLLQAIVEQN